MKIELSLSKKQLACLSGLAQEPDRQRMNRIWLDLAAGREVDTAICFSCGEDFTRQSADAEPTCSTECAKRYAVATEKAAREAENKKRADDRTAQFLNAQWQPVAPRRW